MVEPLRHRQTKGAETDMLDLTPPRHTSTLPSPAGGRRVARAKCVIGGEKSFVNPFHDIRSFFQPSPSRSNSVPSPDI